MTISTPQPAPGTSAPEAANPPPENPPKRRKVPRKALAAGIAVAAVAVVVLLVLTGILPLFPAKPSSNGIPYSRAMELASSALPAPFAGSSRLLVAFGIASTTGGTLSAASFANATTTNCTVTELAGYPPSGLMTIPAFSGTFSSGLSPFWVAVFEASSTGPFVVVPVVLGSASPAAELSGTG